MIAENQIGKGRSNLAMKRGNKFMENYMAVKQMVKLLEHDGIVNTMTLKYSVDDKYVKKVMSKLPPHSNRGFFDNVIVIK